MKKNSDLASRGFVAQEKLDLNPSDEQELNMQTITEYLLKIQTQTEHALKTSIHTLERIELEAATQRYRLTTELNLLQSRMHMLEGVPHEKEATVHQA